MIRPLIEYNNFRRYLSEMEEQDGYFGSLNHIQTTESLTMSYFKLESNNFDTLSGLCPCIFGETIANNIQASVALFVSR